MENKNERLAPVMSLKEWIIAVLITSIPLAGIIMLFVWAFSSSDINENKKNWAKAVLIIQLIGIALVVLVYAVLIGFAFAVRQ